MLVWPETVENRAALRTAISALVAVFISFKFHLETPYWSGMTVVLVSNLYTGSIIDKAMMRIAGTLIGALLGYFVAGLVANSLILYVLSCFLIISLSVYYFNYSQYGYAYLLCALCAFIVISQLTINPQNAFCVAIWRPVEIGIGVVVSAVAAYVLFPNHIKDNLLTQVHDLFDDFLAEFHELYRVLIDSNVDTDALSVMNLNSKRKVRKALDLLNALSQEFGVSKTQVDVFRAFLDSFYQIARQIQYLMTLLPDDIHHLEIKPVFDAIQKDLVRLQSSFNESTLPEALCLGHTLVHLEDQFHKEIREFPVNHDLIYSLSQFFKQIDEIFIIMHSLLAQTPLAVTPKYQLITKQKRLLSDTDLFKHSIKGGLSVLLALGFWLFTNWPGGLNGIISSLIISIKGRNLFDMQKISMYRVYGCFLGGCVALLALNVLEMNLFTLMFILFFSVWAFSWFMFKFPQHAYMGLQANVALIIALAQEGGPPVLLDPPMQRLAGIVIGITATFIVANVLWRSDIWTLLNRYLDKLQKYLVFNIHQVLLVPEEQRSVHDLANLFWLIRSLIESLAQEPLSVTKQEQLNQLIAHFEFLVIVQSIISHLMVSIDIPLAHQTAEILHLDLLKPEKDMIDALEHYQQKELKQVHLIWNNYWEEVNQKSEMHAMPESEMRNLSAYLKVLLQMTSIASAWAILPI